LDEPLGALDQKLRQQMQVELKRLRERLGITFIFVTHDQQEALVMSDRIAVINHGRLEQVGPAEETYGAPRTPFVAELWVWRTSSQSIVLATPTRALASKPRPDGLSGRGI